MTGSFASACCRYLCTATFTLLLGSAAWGAQAGELPLVSRSPLTGIVFEDRPLALPLQINFRMAMLSASTELGRSCDKMEAYGWRMSSSEQGRVDQIFNSTVEHMRHQGYYIQSEAPAAISRDITIFTADRLSQHYIFMWSAGEVGLVMVACESSPPLTLRSAMIAGKNRAENTLTAQDVLQVPSAAQPATTKGDFTPIGVWKGEYTCSPQGYTGATLQIARMKGNDFEGEFHFYPTPKNATVPEGRYAVYGQYDKKSHRILINPGKWLQRPKDYANAVMVGGFDAASGTLSVYFQGVNGCTSFEAKYQSPSTKGKADKVGKKKKSVGKKTEKHTSSMREKKSKTEAVRGKEDNLKSIRPVIIGGHGDQGKATQTPATSKKIDSDFSSALTGNNEGNGPYAKLEEEAPQYATMPNEKALTDKTPAAQFYIVPSKTKAVAKTLTDNNEGTEDDDEMSAQSEKENPVRKLLKRRIKKPASAEPDLVAPPAETTSPDEGALPSVVLPGMDNTTPAITPDNSTSGEGGKPESALSPVRLIEKPVRVASSGQLISPQAPIAPGPSMISPVMPMAPAPEAAMPPAVTSPVAPAAQEPGYVSRPAARNYVAPEAPSPSMILPPSGADILPAKVNEPTIMNPRAPSAPEPEYVSESGGGL